MLDTPDEAIARRVQQGETQLFGVLVERYEEKMMRYARRFLFGYDDAEDVVQEVFIRAYVNIKSFDTHRRFSPWIYRIAHNLFINTIKKKGKETVPLFDPDTVLPRLVAVEQTNTEIETREVREMLDRALRHVPPKYREPLVLYYDEGLSYKEIAEILRIPSVTVGVRLSRGKVMLRKHFFAETHS